MAKANIRVTPRNAQAIEAFLKEVNGRAKAHTYTLYDEIVQVAEEASEILERSGTYFRAAHAAKATALSGPKFSKKFHVIRTHITLCLPNRGDKWALFEARRVGNRRTLPAFNPSVTLPTETFLKRGARMLGDIGISEEKRITESRLSKGLISIGDEAHKAYFIEGSQHFGVPIWTREINARPFKQTAALLPTGEAISIHDLLKELELKDEASLELFRNLSDKDREGLEACVQWFKYR